MSLKKTKKDKSSHLLITVICLLLLLGFTATSLISYYLADESIQNRIRNDSLPLTSDNIYSHVQRDLIRPVLISSVMSKDTFVRDWILNGEQNNQQIINYLNEIQQQYDTITSFFISDKSHHYYHSSGLLKTIDLDDPQDDWYLQSMQSTGMYDINLDTDTANPDRTTFFVNHKVYDYDQNLLGIIGVGLASDVIRNKIDQYQQQFNRTVYFLNTKGEVTLHGAQFSKEKSLHNMRGMQAISKQLFEKTTGSFTYHNDKHQVFVNTRFVDELDWYIVIEEENIKKADILCALWMNLALGALVSLIVSWSVHHLIQRHKAQLRQLMTNDFLTNLASRQGFEPVFHQMLKAAKRNKEPLSLLIIDLDHFKKINDRMGHLEGDAVLRAVARILEDNVRECDALSRWGGEEFVAVLANCNAQSAYLIAEKIRTRITEQVKTGESNDKPITTSIGLAEFDLIESDDSLFERADEALYRAKKNGRDQVVQAIK